MKNLYLTLNAKFLILIMGMIFVTIFAFSCEKKENAKSLRIKKIETSYETSIYYEIIEIDGKQYLASGRGGIILLDSCKCDTTK